MLCSKKMKFKRLGSRVQDVSFATPVKILPSSDWIRASLKKGLVLLGQQLHFPWTPSTLSIPSSQMQRLSRALPPVPAASRGTRTAARSSLLYCCATQRLEQGGFPGWTKDKILNGRSSNRGSNLGQSWGKLWILQTGMRDLWARRLEMGSDSRRPDNTNSGWCVVKR